MNLKLKNPLAFFDLETTGINTVRDRIVEISILKVFPNGDEEILTDRVNPGIPIPMETSLIHGIYDDDIKDAPLFKDLARTIVKFLEGCDLAGFNILKFDVPVLVEELLRAGINFDISKRKLIDAQRIFHLMEKRNLSAAYKFYCNKSLENAHSAEADTNATYEVLLAQLDKYEDLENDVAWLATFSSHKSFADFAGFIAYNKEGEEVFSFGKHNGKKVIDVLDKEPGYFGWLLNADFPLYTKKVLTRIKLQKLNNKLD